MRERIFEIIEVDREDDRISRWYDLFMMAVIMVSIIPLTFKEPGETLRTVENICVGIFIIDYILRLATADFKFGSRSAASFIRYPFSPMAIIDLLSILPSFMMANQGLRLFRLFRLPHTMRVFRVFRIIRYSKSLDIIISSVKRSKEALAAVFIVETGCIIVSALLIFNAEPGIFDCFFDALYWATITLTTIGYGDISPVTYAGRAVTIILSLCGIALIALPAGIITAGYMKEQEERSREEKKRKELEESAREEQERSNCCDD